MRPTSSTARGRPPRADARKASRSRASCASQTSSATCTSATWASRPPPPARSAAPRRSSQPGVGGPGDHVRLVEQREQERAGGGAAAQHDRGLPQRAPQPGQRLGPVAAPRDDLGDHGVVVGRDDVADRDAGVDADPRPGRQPQQLHRPGRGGEVVLGVLGVEPGLDRVPVLGRRVALQPAPGGDVELQLDDVQAGGRLGDRVLDLQPGVDLEEGEQLLGRLVQELHGARAHVARRPHQRAGRGPQVGVLPRAQRRRGGLLHELLVAPLHRAVAHARRPHAAVGVRDHLHLDVAAALDQPLHEHHGVAERAQRLGLRARRARPRARPPSAPCGCRDRRPRCAP